MYVDVCMRVHMHACKYNLDGYELNALGGSKFGQYGEYCDWTLIYKILSN